MVMSILSPAAQKLPIPRPFMRVALSMMRRSVRKRAHFSIDDVAPLDFVGQAFVPVLFGERGSIPSYTCLSNIQGNGIVMISSSSFASVRASASMTSRRWTLSAWPSWRSSLVRNPTAQ